MGERLSGGFRRRDYDERHDHARDPDAFSPAITIATTSPRHSRDIDEVVRYERDRDARWMFRKQPRQKESREGMSFLQREDFSFPENVMAVSDALKRAERRRRQQKELK